MSVGILLVTHGKLGAYLLETMHDMLGELPLAADVLEVDREQARAELVAQGRQLIERLDSGDGVLVLTDAFGSTPSNVANQLAQEVGPVEVIAGVNLPMLIRIFNYPKLPLAEQAQKAVEGGTRGILLCPRASAS